MGRECVVMSWRGGFPHFGVEISPGLVMHFRRRRDHRHRRLPLWFEGELVCCKVKGDWAKRQVGWHILMEDLISTHTTAQLRLIQSKPKIFSR